MVSLCNINVFSIETKIAKCKYLVPTQRIALPHLHRTIFHDLSIMQFANILDYRLALVVDSLSVTGEFHSWPSLT